MPALKVNDKVLAILNKYYSKNCNNEQLKDFIIGYEDNLTNYTPFLYNFNKKKRVSVKRIFDLMKNDTNLKETLTTSEINEISKYLK